MNNRGLILDIKRLVTGKILLKEPLAQQTSFKIGGPADIWVELNDPMEFMRLARFLKGNSIPMHIIGGGTNILVGDRGLRGVTISTRAYDRLDFSRDAGIIVSAGVKISRLVRESMNRSLKGLEFMAGIPGTVGGAIRMNAGIKVGNNGTRAIYRGMGELVEEVGVISGKLGTFYILSEKELKFGYRDSNLKDSIILWAKMKKLTKDDKDEIAASVREFLGYKKKVQELNRPSAGCIFKNIAGSKLTSGQLIESSGLKGARAGDAYVSNKHANFIINMGKARASDVLRLIDIVRQKVKKGYGVWLELEIELMGCDA